MATSTTMTKLTFQPFSSILNPGFWQNFTNIKLDKLQLKQDPHSFHGTYSCNLARDLPCLASFDHNSFDDKPNQFNRFTSPLHGKLICMNLMQDFIDYDKKAFISALGREIWQSICDGSALADPEKCLSRCGLLVYADLKRYKYYYWFSFPAINYPSELFLRPDAHSYRLITQVFSHQALTQLQEQFNDPSNERAFQRSYFILEHNTELDVAKCHPLSKYDLLDKNASSIYFAYTDPSADLEHPGWPARNYLALISHQFKLSEINLIRVRVSSTAVSQSKFELRDSLVISVTCNISPPEASGPNQSKGDWPIVTGWERNESHQLAPRRVNLDNVLNPVKIAEDAVNLNLRLMKWRLVPSLDLESIANTKCLILGCGTLGCHIARGLLSWGVKHISLVDNSKVSYSNPVRQSLYTFEDCVPKGDKSGTYKATAAALSLQRIHPTVNVKPYILSIPMPGHHVMENDIQSVEADVETLEQLIEDHDAVFLVMDTRESRWLPSLIGLSKQKLIINAAIGFDTFLLQRYGIRDYAPHDCTDGDELSEKSLPSSNSLSASNLGCYFCNDIVAPGDSTLDRTLDQQCTVSRPGVSMMVSALAVELLASIMSSPHKGRTPAPTEIQNDPSMIDEADMSSDLGIVPHSIRGNLNRYHMYMPTSPSFNKCSACSPSIVSEYRAKGFEFLLRVFNDPSHLEDLAGLKDLQNVSDDVWAFDSDDNLCSEPV